MDLEEQLSRLDLSTYPIKEIEKIVEGLYKLGLLSTSIPAGATFQRCSPISLNETIYSVSRLSYNPHPEKFGRANASCLEKFGRAYFHNIQMFYGCYDVPNEQTIEQIRESSVKERAVSFFEAKAHRYPALIYSKWLVKQPLQVGCIIHPSVFPNSNNDYLEELKNNYTSKVERNIDASLDNIWAQVCAQFAKVFLDDNDYNYLFTALLTNKLLEVSKLSKVSPYDGILYPSVKAEGNYCMNLALTKDAVDRKISFMKACKSSIKVDDNGKYYTIPIQRGVSPDGQKLIWFDEPKH